MLLKFDNKVSEVEQQEHQVHQNSSEPSPVFAKNYRPALAAKPHGIIVRSRNDSGRSTGSENNQNSHNHNPHQPKTTKPIKPPKPGKPKVVEQMAQTIRIRNRSSSSERGRSKVLIKSGLMPSPTFPVDNISKGLPVLETTFDAALPPPGE